MTGSGNHTYLLHGPGPSALLIDAGTGDPRHLAELSAALRPSASTLSHVLVTHGHHDHVAGASLLASAYPPVLLHKWPWPDEDRHYDVTWQTLTSTSTFALSDQSNIRTIHTPGHSPDHVVFWHEPSRSIFTGDLVLPGASVVIQWSRRGDMAQYLDSIRSMIALQPKHLYPAHGPEVDEPLGLLEVTLSHRLLRERQVLERLTDGLDSVEAIVESIYHGLAPVHLAAARENVRAHLEKLQQEGRAVREDARWTSERST